jgi:hypothetical protein
MQFKSTFRMLIGHRDVTAPGVAGARLRQIQPGLKSAGGTTLLADRQEDAGIVAGALQFDQAWCAYVAFWQPTGLEKGTKLARSGSSAAVVTKYLRGRDLVVVSAGRCSVLILLSLGITRGKWGSMPDALNGRVAALMLVCVKERT